MTTTERPNRAPARPSPAHEPRRTRNGRHDMFPDQQLARVIHAERAARWSAEAAADASPRPASASLRSGGGSVARWSPSAPGSPPSPRSGRSDPAEGSGRPGPPGDTPLTVLTHELKASYAFVERNFFLTRRYWGWELAFLVYSVAGALSVSLIGVESGSTTLLLSLMIGAIFWNYLSVVFSWIAETIAVERWEGTLEYTMMAPVRRWTQLLGSCSYAIVYGLVHTAAILVVMLLFFPQLDLSQANLPTAATFMALGLVQLRRDRDDGRDPAPALRGAGRPDDVRPAVLPAARQRRLLLGRRSCRPGCRSCRACRRRRTSSTASARASSTACPLTELGARHRGRWSVMGVDPHPARDLGLRPGRALRQADRQAQAGGLSDDHHRHHPRRRSRSPEAPPVAGLRFRHYRGPIRPSGDGPGQHRRPALERRDRGRPARRRSTPTTPTSRTATSIATSSRPSSTASSSPTAGSSGPTATTGPASYGAICMVDPAVRRRGIGTALLAWQRRRSAEIAAGLPDDRPTLRDGLRLRSRHGRAGPPRGGRLSRRSAGSASCNRLDFEDIPDLPLPDGIEVRPVDPTDAGQLRRVWEAGAEAFAEHWGESETTGRRTASQGFRASPELPAVAVAGRLRRRRRSPATSSTTSIRPSPTGRGRAGPSRSPSASRIAVAASPGRCWPAACRTVRDAGATRAALGVDSQNVNQALDLYEGLGFRVVSEQFEYQGRACPRRRPDRLGGPTDDRRRRWPTGAGTTGSAAAFADHAADGSGPRPGRHRGPRLVPGPDRRRARSGPASRAATATTPRSIRTWSSRPSATGSPSQGARAADHRLVQGVLPRRTSIVRRAPTDHARARAGPGGERRHGLRDDLAQPGPQPAPARALPGARLGLGRRAGRGPEQGRPRGRRSRRAWPRPRRWPAAPRSTS